MSAPFVEGAQFVRANGIDVFCEVRGKGPWVVLSHSLACDHTMWDEQIPLLESKYRILRYDTRGHGRSSAPAAPYTLDVLAGDLKALLRALRIERPHFVGLSMGGMIGETLAVRDPSVFRTLTLCDTTSAYPPATASVWDERIRVAREKGMPALVESTLTRWFTENFRRRRPDVTQRFTTLISRTPVEGYVGCSQALVKINLTGALKRLAMPALVIVGERDRGLPASRALAATLPRARLVVVEGAGHVVNLARPAEFNAAVAEFLATVP